MKNTWKVRDFERFKLEKPQFFFFFYHFNNDILVALHEIAQKIILYMILIHFY